MPSRIQSILGFGRLTLARYSAVGGSLVAAGLSFYVFFALAPTTLATGALAGVFLTQEQIQQGVREIIDRSPDSLQPLQPALDAIVRLADRGSAGALTVATIASFFVAIYVASRVVYGLRVTLTRIFGAPDRVHGLIDRAFSSLIALAGIVVMVVLLLVLQLLPRVLDELGIESVLRLLGTQLLNWATLAVFAFVICVVAIVFIPDVRPRVKIRSWGVAFATVWMLGSSAVFGLYTSLSNTVGAAIVVFGAPIVLMLWAYLIFVGILLGAAIEAQRMGVAKPQLPAPVAMPAWMAGFAKKLPTTIGASKNSD